jgi:YesN/AraC family two-component response regulator
MEKILVIDDEKPTLMMFRLFLDAYGYAVFTAENGAEGLEIFKQERPQIVITDIKMPGVDGLSALRQMKDIDPGVEVIVITGHGDTDLAKQARDWDAADFINKPIHKEALDAALKKARERLDLSENPGKE